MTPYINDVDFTLYVGDVRQVLSELEPGTVDCCVTSPPYWGLRDYGSDGQIGLEATPEAFVQELVEVFRGVRMVLADHGTVWLNLGDSYAGVGKGPSNERPRPGAAQTISNVSSAPNKWQPIPAGLKSKNLVGIPWRVAFALQADGWWLRSDIIWSKPNPMPESVTDRPTKSHEYVFLLSKGPRYFFDQEAVREAYTDPREGGDGFRWGSERYTNQTAAQSNHTPTGRGPDGRKVTKVEGKDGSEQHRNGERWPHQTGRNIRSVWEIATQPYPDAHFATFPEALPERCIKAGCPEQVCVTCGKPRERLTQKEGESSYEAHKRKTGETWQDLNERHREQGKAVNGTGKNTPGTLNPTPRSTQGWSDCGHNNWRVGTVLDPFMGSGTTAKVARRLGRRSIGVELNPEYAALCAKRLQQLSLLAETAA